MGEAWIDDERRPGGIGRAERQRIFWERVASGRPHSFARSSLAEPANSADRSPDYPQDAEIESEGPWESAQLSLVTLLTVMVFGLGWVTFELGGVSPEAGYDVLAFETTHVSTRPEAGRAEPAGTEAGEPESR